MIIFFKLNTIFIYLALIISKFKIKMVYFKINNPDNHLFKKLVSEKKLVNFTEMDFNTKYSSHSFFCDEPAKITEKSIKKISNNFGKQLMKYLGSSKKELKSILFNRLMIDMDLYQLIKFYSFYRPKKKFVFVLGIFSINQLIILKTNKIKIYNNLIQIISLIYTSITLLSICLKNIFNNRKFSKLNINYKVKNKKDFNVIFYPHKTTNYGNGIYNKNFFILKN